MIYLQMFFEIISEELIKYQIYYFFSDEYTDIMKMIYMMYFNSSAISVSYGCIFESEKTRKQSKNI